MNFYSDNEALAFHLKHPDMQKCVDMKERQYKEKDQYDYAPRDFEDAMDNYDKVMEIIGDIAGNVLAANAEEVDHQGPSVENYRVRYADGTRMNHEKLTQAGVYGIALPRAFVFRTRQGLGWCQGAPYRKQDGHQGVAHLRARV